MVVSYPRFRAKCMEALETVDIDSAKVLQIIRSLDCNKADGWDDISIAMLKICEYAAVPPLCLTYTQCLETGSYPQTWKMANVLPIHKKESRQIKTNYRPISLLPIFGKIFQKSIFDTLYEYLCVNNLLAPNQSGFRPGDSTINQLIFITHSIYTAFEEFPYGKLVQFSLTYLRPSIRFGTRDFSLKSKATASLVP